MHAVILAAGYATRLGELGAEVPKALLPLGGRPLLDRLLDEVEACPGVRSVVLVSNRRFLPAFQGWLDGPRPDRRIPVRILDDGTRRPGERLGAVGDLRLGLEATGPEGPWLVLASDTLFDFSLASLVRAVEGDGRWAAAVPLLRERDPAVLRRRGVAEVAEDGRLVGFQEKPEAPRSEDTVPPIYLLRSAAARAVTLFLAEGGNPDAPGHFLGWLVPRLRVLGVRVPGKRLDVGTPEGYREALARFGSADGDASG
jgi:glucose-1-phosphate thymidylyltransferase